MIKPQSILSGVAIALSAAALFVALENHRDYTSQHVKVVTVDMSRIINSERASVAAILNGGTPAIEPTAFPSQLKDTLGQVAGPDTIILVRQAVAVPQLSDIPDITKAVLHKLGLPETAAHLPTPSQSVVEHMGSTGFSYSQYFKSLDKKQAQTAADILRSAHQEQQGDEAP